MFFHCVLQLMDDSNSVDADQTRRLIWVCTVY